jgi:hypothetical protein
MFYGNIIFRASRREQIWKSRKAFFWGVVAPWVDLLPTGGFYYETV